MTWVEICEPETAAGLVAPVRESLRRWAGIDPEEYEPGRFTTTVGGFEVLVIVSEAAFPFIRLEHLALENVPAECRHDVVEFVNGLHGRTSTLGSHWWLGNEHLWQCGAFDGARFDAIAFLQFLSDFVRISQDRTPETLWRFGHRDPTEFA